MERLKQFWNRRLVYWNRDRIILNDLKRPAKKDRVNLHWYSCNRSDKKENFGDYLSPFVYQYMLEYFHLDAEQIIGGGQRHLYGIGSILFWGRQDAIIWGSGLLMYPPEHISRAKKFHLDIRAVRGPETRKILLREGFVCPEVYGDPAILMPLIYTPAHQEKEYEYSIILHKSDNKEVSNQIPIMCRDYREVIDKIVKSKLVISSSLHGIIVAEAYGIPAIMLSDKRSDFNLLKYHDYYYSTKRENYPIATSIEEALSIEPVQLPDNLDKLREGLINAFPVDLWRT